jgi:hypothetical protein
MSATNVVTYCLLWKNKIYYNSEKLHKNTFKVRF